VIPAPVYRDPFDPACRLPAGVIVALPDLDHLGRWTARRAGRLQPEGQGQTQLEAIDDLERREKNLVKPCIQKGRERGKTWY